MENRPTPAPIALAPQGASPLARLAQIPLRSRIALTVAIALLTALMVFAFSRGSEPEWRILYTSLSDKDGGAVIAALQQLNVPHKFSDGGTAILVPATQVHEARLKLASQGLPKGGTVGFELMENQKFGTTPFQERLNFQRGLEGELARSIMSLSAVQAARVHLALPTQTAFMREQQKPSASVLLTLYNGRSLERGQVAGIVHLVASSVPELSAQSVSVVDQSGALLSDTGNAPNGLDAPQLQYVRQTEQSLSQRIVSILEPIVGAGNVRAQVAADIDFTQSESTAELYGPNQGSSPAAVRSQQLSEVPNSQGAPVGGAPGSLSNQPSSPSAAPINGAMPGTAASTGNVKREAVTNFEVDKTVKVVRNAAGNVRRLSAAVIVNHQAGKDPKAAAKPLSTEQMEQINALVREAIGFNKDRGDSVQVVNAPFASEQVAAAPEVPMWRQPEVVDFARASIPWIAVPLAALVIILGLVRPALRTARLLPAPRLAATVQDAVTLEAPAGGVPLAMSHSMGANDPRMQTRQVQLEGIRQLAKQDPATVANVVRNWASQPA